MTPKELLYLEDALNHEQFIKAQITDCASRISDNELKNFVTSLSKTHNDIYKSLYQTL
ncbi:MAG: hypothetical protein ACOX3X_05590 [Eubacteriales bacterium]|jgi:hypothetical protein